MTGGLQQLAGAEWYQEAKELHAHSIKDERLEGVHKLSTLEVADSYRTRVTDAGLAHLKGLPSLQHLDLDSTEVTCAGLAHLKEMPHLQSLRLASSVSGREIMLKNG